MTNIALGQGEKLRLFTFNPTPPHIPKAPSSLPPDGWADGQTAERTDRRTDGWTDGRVEQMDGPLCLGAVSHSTGSRAPQHALEASKESR